MYHVTSRDNAGQDIFLGDEDRQVFLEILEQAVDRFNWLCHAYCLMPNHYHLLVETGAPTLSRGMRHLNGVYTQSFNRRHARGKCSSAGSRRSWRRRKAISSRWPGTSC